MLSVLKMSDIFCAVSGMNGESSFAISLIASTNSYNTFLSFVSHGFLSWMNSLQMSMNVKISFSALSILNSSKCFSICFLFSFFRRGFSVFSMPYFSARADVRETRLPSLFASSLLCLSISACVEKSPSSPKDASRNRKYLAESTPVIAISSSTLITLPRDFEIFSLLNVHHPCAYTVFGTSIPADIRKAGQYTVWNQRMSLPIRLTSGGQNFSFPPLVAE